jgi:hypothetical protein
MDVFIDIAGGFEDVGIKFGGRLAAVEVGMLPPYGDDEYGV